MRGFSYEDFALALPNKGLGSCVDSRTRICCVVALSNKRVGSCVDSRTRICCVLALSNKSLGSCVVFLCVDFCT